MEFDDYATIEDRHRSIFEALDSSLVAQNDSP